MNKGLSTHGSSGPPVKSKSQQNNQKITDLEKTIQPHTEFHAKQRLLQFFRNSKHSTFDETLVCIILLYLFLFIHFFQTSALSVETNGITVHSIIQKWFQNYNSSNDSV